MEKLKQINIDFGSRLKAARIASKMTTAELAKFIGISTMSLTAVENGKNGFSMKNIIKACEVLGITTDSLLMTPHQYDKVSMMMEKIKFIDPAYYPILKAIVNNIRAIDQNNIE